MATRKSNVDIDDDLGPVAAAMMAAHIASTKRGPGRPKGSKNKKSGATSMMAAAGNATTASKMMAAAVAAAAAPSLAKRGPGRPKGSKNKPAAAGYKSPSVATIKAMLRQAGVVPDQDSLVAAVNAYIGGTKPRRGRPPGSGKKAEKTTKIANRSAAHMAAMRAARVNTRKGMASRPLSGKVRINPGSLPKPLKEHKLSRLDAVIANRKAIGATGNEHRDVKYRFTLRELVARRKKLASMI